MACRSNNCQKEHVICFQEPPYLFVETFSGEAAATRAVRHCFPARATAASDIKYTVSMDINTSGGMGTLALLLHVQ